MNQEEINKQIFDRLEKIEGVVFSQDRIIRKIDKTSKKNKAEDLKAPIQKLFDSGLFKDEPKVDMDVLFELQKRLLTEQKPLRSSIVNVLRNMVRNDLLERLDVIHGKKKLIGYKNKS